MNRSVTERIIDLFKKKPLFMLRVSTYDTSTVFTLNVYDDYVMARMVIRDDVRSIEVEHLGPRDFENGVGLMMEEYNQDENSHFWLDPVTTLRLDSKLKRDDVPVLEFFPSDDSLGTEKNKILYDLYAIGTAITLGYRAIGLVYEGIDLHGEAGKILSEISHLTISV